MQTAATPLTHSGMGIASLALSLLSGLGLLLIFVVAGLAESQPRGLDENSPAAVVLGLVMVLLTTIVQLLALGLGIAAVVQPARNKTFGVLGLVFSCACLLGSWLLMLIGTVLE